MLEWLNFSGAPALLLPDRLRNFWHGFYLPHQGPGTPDLALADGNWQIWDDFSTENPRSDYQRLCAELGEAPLPVALGDGHALAWAPGGADVFAWWQEESMLIANGSDEVVRLALNELPWSPGPGWRVPDGPLRLINSCLHGCEDESVTVGLAPGAYSLSTCQHSNAWLCRFIRSL